MCRSVRPSDPRVTRGTIFLREQERVEMIHEIMRRAVIRNQSIDLVIILNVTLLCIVSFKGPMLKPYMFCCSFFYCVLIFKTIFYCISKNKYYILLFQIVLF